MRKSLREKLLEERRSQFTQEELDFEGLIRLICDGDRPVEERRLNPTQREFILDPVRIGAYMGPAGCAKTSTICAIALLRSLLEPGSKGLVARHDYNDLMGTTKVRMEEMLARLPKGTLLDRDKSPPETWWIQPAGADAEPSKLTFMGLKEQMGSYEFNWAIIDEADECEEKRIKEVDTRLRYLRRGVPREDNNYTLRLSFNPPDKTHWLYTACTGLNYQDKKVAEPWMKMFVPRPDENLRNLPPDYYERLKDSLSEDMLDRLVKGEWGATFPGEPVYRQYKRDIHAPRRLSYNPAWPLYRFWDFGYRRPSCIWAQVDEAGRLYIMHELLGKNDEATAFVAKVKAEQGRRFPGARVERDYGDPAAAQKKDTGSTLKVLLDAGIQLSYRASTIESGVRLLRKMFEQLVEGVPAVNIDNRCTVVMNGLRGGYRMDDKGVKPVKDGFYDHLMDALRYGIINLFGDGGEPTARLTESLPDSIEYSPMAEDAARLEAFTRGFQRTPNGIYLPASVASDGEED